MQEIQVGEYVRTKNGYIRKIVKKREDLNEYCYIVDVPYFNKIINEDTLGVYSKEDVAKHSFNLLKILEKGDIVVINCTKYEIISISDKYFKTTEDDYLTVDDIESIVTHKQFNSVKYKVK